MPVSDSTEPAVQTRTLHRQLAAYARPAWRSAAIQLTNTLMPFALLWWLMFHSLNVSYVLTLVLAIPAAGFMVRILVIAHDCSHGSFVPSRSGNTIIGMLLGVIAMAPYHYWRRIHLIHHATSGNLDRRTLGDTLTVAEYQALTPKQQFAYRLYRNPLVILGIGPFFMFWLKYRFPWDIPLSWRMEWFSVLYTNLALLGLCALAWTTTGLDKALLIQAPIWLLAHSFAIWIFYVQHQHEQTYWQPDAKWDFTQAALRGSSFLNFSPLLHWFTGNIGYHHIHHLVSRIPNYLLPTASRDLGDALQTQSLTLIDGLQTFRCKLWNEHAGKMVGFPEEQTGTGDRNGYPQPTQPAHLR